MPIVLPQPLPPTPDASATVAGKVNLSTQTLGTGTKTFTGEVVVADLKCTPGTPPGVPAEGQVYYDSTDHTLKFRNASSWIDCNGNTAWGSITGTLSAQTDLNGALGAKANLSGATFTGAISATNLSGTNTGDDFIGTIDTGTKSANGLQLTSHSIIAQTADATYPGLVSALDQTFAGIKTFSRIVSPILNNTNGTGSTDVCVKIGTSVADASVNATAKLLSIRTVLGGTEVEKLHVLKSGALVVTNSGSNVGVQATSASSYGVYGISASSYGVYGESSTGVAIYGTSTSTGIWGNTSGSSSGVYGASVGGSGVRGQGGTYGVRGSGTTAGVYGENSSGGNAVQGDNTGTGAGSGVYGWNTSTNAGAYGVKGYSAAGGAGVYGISDTKYGVYGFAGSSGSADAIGVYGYSNWRYGIKAASGNSYAPLLITPTGSLPSNGDNGAIAALSAGTLHWYNGTTWKTVAATTDYAALSGATFTGPVVVAAPYTAVTDIYLKAGSSTAEASVLAGAKLFSARTGIGGTEVEYLSISKTTTTSGTINCCPPGGAAADVGVKIGTSTADGSVNAATKLLSVQTGFGGTPIEQVTFIKGGAINQQGTDSSATPGAATINKATGISAIASGSSTCTITNSLAATGSRILITWLGDHGAARSWVVRAAGSFTVTLSSNAAANTSFAWEVSALV